MPLVEGCQSINGVEIEIPAGRMDGGGPFRADDGIALDAEFAGEGCGVDWIVRLTVGFAQACPNNWRRYRYLSPILPRYSLQDTRA